MKQKAKLSAERSESLGKRKESIEYLERRYSSLMKDLSKKNSISTGKCHKRYLEGQHLVELPKLS